MRRNEAGSQRISDADRQSAIAVGAPIGAGCQPRSLLCYRTIRAAGANDPNIWRATLEPGRLPKGALLRRERTQTGTPINQDTNRKEVRMMPDDKTNKEAQDSKAADESAMATAMPFPKMMAKLMARCGCRPEQMRAMMAACFRPEKKESEKTN